MKTILPVFIKQKGFTLIELIIVFSVIAILSTISVASFVDFSRQQTRSQAINDFINNLNTAKVKAASQINQCTSGKNLDGYSVTLNKVANTYALNIVCSGVATPVSATPTSLPSGISFDSTTNATNIFFAVLTGAVTGTGNVVFSSVYSSDKKTVSINSVGVISN